MTDEPKKLWSTPVRLAWKLGVLNWVVERLIKDGKLATKQHVTKKGKKCTLVEVVDHLPIELTDDMINWKKVVEPEG